MCFGIWMETLVYGPPAPSPPPLPFLLNEPFLLSVSSTQGYSVGISLLDWLSAEGAGCKAGDIYQP